MNNSQINKRKENIERDGFIFVKKKKKKKNDEECLISMHVKFNSSKLIQYIFSIFFH